MQFRPLHDRVVVRRLEAEAKTGGEASYWLTIFGTTGCAQIASM